MLLAYSFALFLSLSLWYSSHCVYLQSQILIYRLKVFALDTWQSHTVQCENWNRIERNCLHTNRPYNVICHGSVILYSLPMDVCVCGSLLAFNAELHSISCRFFLSRLVLWKCIECKNRSENFSFAISSILLAGFHRRKSLMRRKCKTWTLDCVLIVYFSCMKIEAHWFMRIVLSTNTGRNQAKFGFVVIRRFFSSIDCNVMWIEVTNEKYKQLACGLWWLDCKVLSWPNSMSVFFAIFAINAEYSVE